MIKSRLFIGSKRMGLSLFLNILGLTVAFTAFLVIMVQVTYDMGFDNFYKNKERIYRVEYINPYDNDYYSASLSRPLCIQLAESSPEIEAWANWSYWIDDVKVKPADNVEQDYVLSGQFMVSDGTLDVFEFNLIEGDPEDFKKPRHAVIPVSLSKTLFPDGDAVGKVIDLKDMDDYTVAGVYEDFPENSSVRNIIYWNMGDYGVDDASEWSYPLYVRINDPANKEKVRAAMNDIFAERMKEEEDVSKDDQLIRLNKIHDIYFSRDVRYDYVDKGNRSSTISLITIAIFILFIAIINFVNFSLASVPAKIKAINVQKILGNTNGALRRSMVWESVILALLSFALALLILDIIKGSKISEYVSGNLALSANWGLVLLSGGVALLTGMAAGLYPAFYSTSYQPALVLKGSFSLSPGGRRLRSFLIAFQFTISMILIIVALFIKVQTDYMKKYDMGFRTENIVNYRISNSIALQKASFVSKLKESPLIKDVTFADGPLVSNGKMGWGRNYHGEQVNFDCLPVDPNFVKFFDMEIIEGRGFEESDQQKANGTLIFNETAEKKYGFKVGDVINGHHTDPADIVGIVKDFNFQPLQYSINPIALYVMGSEPWRHQTYSYIKISPGSTREALKYIETVVKEFNPAAENVTFQFMDEGVNRLYAKEDALASLILIFCYLSVFISVMGILGLIYFETRFRRKEIALRRVMGSGIGELLAMLNMAYVKISLLSFVVAAPVAWYICRIWVKNFQYQAPVPVWIFLAALFAILIVNTIIITSRSYRAVNANPVDSISSQ